MGTIGDIEDGAEGALECEGLTSLFARKGSAFGLYRKKN